MLYCHAPASFNLVDPFADVPDVCVEALVVLVWQAAVAMGLHRCDVPFLDWSVVLIMSHVLEPACLPPVIWALQEARTQLAATKQDVTALTSRAADAERAASTAAQELESVSRATDALRAQLACKRALLTAIVKLCAHKKAAGEGTHDAISAIYNVALSEGCMRLRLCDVPLALLGSLAAGVADSGALTKLVIDMDASREMVWEKAALRVTCLASALALNTSLRSVELIGWTWDEAGSGLAAPFLTLGAVPGTPGPAAARAGSLPGGGSSGAVAAMLPPPPAFTYIQVGFPRPVLLQVFVAFR